MQLTDGAIVLSLRRHGENSAVAQVLTRQHGRYAGVVRAISSKSNRGIWQSGNVVNMHWQARLSEHLGSMKAELLQPYAAYILPDATRLSALTRLCALLSYCLPERAPYPHLYAAALEVVHALANEAHWQRIYALFELKLLAACGFSLQLSRCIATGATENLHFISPKSGCAVCEEAGAPYADKLLPYPKGLQHDADLSPDEFHTCLNVTGFFLEQWLLKPQGKTLPALQRTTELA